MDRLGKPSPFCSVSLLPGFFLCGLQWFQRIYFYDGIDIQNMRLLKNLSPAELNEFFIRLDEKPFRTKQLMKWLYQNRNDNFDEMINFSGVLRQKLAQEADISKPTIIAKQKSVDGSALKLALKLTENKQEVIECVALYDDKRRTACLSSQLGCKYGCAYCSTALMGFSRNLTQREILEQLIALEDHGDQKRISNIVFMGMGEPLDNLENVLRAIDIIQSEYGFAIGGRKITISTCGLVPKIKELADKETNLGLAISLNAPNNAIRNKLLPINKKYPIEELLKAAEYYFQKTGRRVTFEYVLIENVNDSMEHFRELISILSHFPCKLNLIGFNPKPDCSFSSPSPGKIQKILSFLQAAPFTVTLRKSLGTEISAACGQLYREIVLK
jgi:23S rRNA (adenine2503-C2)-methyltransferase